MKKVRILAVLVAASVFMLFALGSGSNSSESTKEISGSNSASSSNSSQSGIETKAPVSSLTPKIEESVVYEENGIKITAKEYTTGSFWGDGIKFLIENNTSKNITVSTHAVIVNNYMISDLFVASVAAGKKTNETMNLLSSELQAAGIDVIGQVEVYFHIYDSDTYGDIANPDCVTIRTSLYDQMDTSVEDAGQLLFEQGGVKIVGKYVNESSFWGAAVLFYIENNSGRNVRVRADNVSINGFTLNSAIFSCEVYNGKKAYDDMTLFSSELKENGIETIEEVSLKFEIVDPDSYSTIAESGEITFSAK
ncbi:MAG: hypothetical protein IK088_05540 [Lachnospiraceae bacterium]|nr:hypothetical protein [Lachnospiraceae bacterium]